MKNLYSHILFAFIFTFLGTQFSFAQDSVPIAELRQKLKEAKDEKSQVSARLKLLYQFNREGSSDSIIANGFKVIDYLHKVKDIPQLGSVYMTISGGYLSKGDVKTAEKYRLEAQKYLIQSDSYNAKALLLITNAQNLSLQNKYEEAVSEYNSVIKLNKQSGNKLSPNLIGAVFISCLGNIIQQNNFSEAYKKALEYLDYTNKNDKASSYIPTYYVGLLQYNMKNYQMALDAFDKSQSLLPPKSDAFVAEINIVRSFCYIELKDYEKAKQFANNSLSYMKSQKLIQSLPRLYYLFAKIYQKEKFYKQSIDYAQKAYDLGSDDAGGQLKANSKLLLTCIKIDQIKDDNVKFSNEAERNAKLRTLRAELESDHNALLSKEVFHNTEVDSVVWEYYSKIDEMLGDYKSAFDYYKKYKEIENQSTSAENIRGVEQVQSERALSEQRLKIKFEEETKRIQLQKEFELKALRYEFDKKQAAAKTEVERQRLLLEEEHKRREISIKYDEEQKAVALKYEQEKKVAKAEQEKKDAEAKAELSKSKNIRNMSIGGALAALLLLGFAGWSYNQKRKDGIKIAAEKKKSEDLLLNILPQEVAQELKEKGKSEAKYYDEVSVLFTDFVNFTEASEKIGVQELLEELNVCFTEFDNIMGKHGLEKIKTIGDAYLAVSGLPTINKDHAKNAIAASQDILKFIEERKKVSPNALDLRIGIHSGHVIAGIVGVKKFAYDIWGDTVNTAARMEQAGEKGKINISKNTYELVKDNFSTSYRGQISVKGKGEMEMYFIEA